jgi:TetR/AcrR family transcriptional repressor of nem operon
MKTASFDSPTRLRLLEASASLMLEQGFSGTSVDSVCSRAGLTKGAFFHHFEDKEALACALVEKWSDDRRRSHSLLFGANTDPLQRVYAYADGVAGKAKDGSLLKGCLIGSFAQELQQVPSVRRACRKGFEDWVEQLSRHIALAKERHAPDAALNPEESAEAFIAHIEGAILIAKASDDAGPVVRAATAFKRHLKAALAA